MAYGKTAYDCHPLIHSLDRARDFGRSMRRIKCAKTHLGHNKYCTL